MNCQHTRRDFLKTASAAAAAAAALCSAGAAPAVRAGPAATTLPAAPEPIQRVGGSLLKISLNAYSFRKILNDRNRQSGPGTSLMELVAFCARNNFDGLDPTG